MPTLVSMAYKYAHRPAVHLPEELDLSYVGQLHAHDVRHAVRGVQSPTTCWCARSTASSSCTPTTSRTLPTSTVRLCGSLGHQPVRRHRGGRGLPVGPGARRRQRGGAQHARRHPGDGGVEKIGEFIRQVKDKNSNVKLMGFGHRVYKNYDPRAKLMRETCHEVLSELGLHDDPLFKLAMALEKIALEDDYFVSRKLYPNVDFYSGIVQRAIGIPVAPVHRHLRARAHGGLDRAAERDDRRPRVQDRAAAPAFFRRHPTRRQTDRPAPLSRTRFALAADGRGGERATPVRNFSATYPTQDTDALDVPSGLRRGWPLFCAGPVRPRHRSRLAWAGLVAASRCTGLGA